MKIKKNFSIKKIKKGDYVQVITGRKEKLGGNKGKRGKVLKVLRKEGKLIVSNINCFKISNKANSKKSQDDKLRIKEFPIDISNVCLVDKKTNKPTRIGLRKKSNFIDKNTKTQKSEYNNKIRYSKKSGCDI